jgi:hypothetical protein
MFYHVIREVPVAMSLLLAVVTLQAIHYDPEL